MAGQPSTAILLLDKPTKDHLPSLSTISARAFHPVNPYWRRAIPDTPLTRDWWIKVFTDYINNEYSYALTATDPQEPNKVLGVLLLSYNDPSAKRAGTWADFEITPDHDAEAAAAMLGAGADAHPRLMKGNSHLVVEFFGVDHAFKGHGIGQKLLRKACEIAGGGGYDTFVCANGSAAGFYERFGFEVRERKVMPGEEKYVECMMVRYSQG
ncbi:hypothetical protein LTR62_001483 [Meristemomyces frigidus]|uniref:N-acetyltransferase domain-containing protein n=1 Tax=Meristemomyces frigidus TaxID=1508187 RepID=A0AAN7YLP9_9PEZI|nr:hypothetical protein LTR62_001483 [Meristemomyces frigidus]